MLPNSSDMIRLTLSNNSISKIEPGTFKNFVNLEHLMLWSNPLGPNLSDEIFTKELKNLIVLNMMQCNITFLEDEYFGHLM